MNRTAVRRRVAVRLRVVVVALVATGVGLLVPFATNATSSATQSFKPVADTYADSSHPDQVHGSETTIQLDGSNGNPNAPVSDGFLKFDVSGLSGPVVSAHLRLYVVNGGDSFAVHAVADNSWDESTLTWSNAPPLGSALASSGTVSNGSWVSLDVTPAVAGDGMVSFALDMADPSPMSIASSEGSSSTAPQLIVETDATAPSSTNAPTISGQPVVGQTLTATPGMWAGTSPISFAYQWQRCDGGGSNCTPVGGATAASYLVTSADLASTLRVAVTATNAAGSSTAVSAATGSVTAPTGGVDTTPPSVPADLVQIGSTQTSITVDWSPSTDDVGVAGYHTYRNGTRTYTTTTTSHTFSSNLACGTSYTLGVDAFDAAGNVSAQATIVASTSPCSTTTDSAPPSAPSALTVTSVSASSIGLSWAASSDNVGVSGYDVLIDGSKTATTGSTSYTFSNLACGTSYTLGVDAYDAAGNRSAVTSMMVSTSDCAGQADTTPPSAPTGLTVTAATQTSITLSWSPSTDDVAVAGYDTYRNGTKTYTTATTSHTFSSNLTCGTSYTLGVDAFDAAGNVSAVTTLTASTAPCATTLDTTPPNVPTGLSIAAATQTSITLSWLPSTDNVGVTGYDAYLNGTAIDATILTSEVFSNLACGTSYTLGVDAFDAAGNTSAVASLVASTAPCLPSSSGPCGTAATAPNYQHVVWIVFENHAYSQIIGSSSAPFFNSLANDCGLATNSYAETHPSLPNYIAMTSGSTQGITDDAGPASHPLDVPNIFQQLGTNWHSLMESMPSNCAKSDSGSYVVHHNPAAYYTNLAGTCSSQDVPLRSSPDLSSKFTLVVPNNCNNMHSCSIGTGDTWLKNFMPTVYATAEWQAGNTAVFITFDEDNNTSTNKIATIVVSPSTVPGTRASTTFTHYSLLRTTEELLGLGYVGKASTAASMLSAFGL